jgi:hypothetical protein
MKPRKPKVTEPSPRAKLSAAFLEAFEQDFRSHGVEVIEKMRQSHRLRSISSFSVFWPLLLGFMLPQLAFLLFWLLWFMR